MSSRFPYCVVVDGKKYDIATSYRIVFEWISLAENPFIPSAFKQYGLISLFYYEEPKDMAKASAALIHFLHCGRAPEDQGEECAKAYDFKQDYGEIWAGFKSQYNIDLDKNLTMHWWEFKALFDELSDESRIKQLIQIRTMPYPDASKEPERYAAVADAKTRCALKEWWEVGQ